jgi:hypothetical protein
VLRLGSVGEVEEQAASPINPPKTNHRVVAIVVSWVNYFRTHFMASLPIPSHGSFDPCCWWPGTTIKPLADRPLRSGSVGDDEHAPTPISPATSSTRMSRIASLPIESCP